MANTDLIDAQYIYFNNANNGVGLPGISGSATSTSDTVRVPMDARDEFAVSGSQSAAAVLFTQDMLGYNSISVQTISAGTTCTITYETSDDNTNWLSIDGHNRVQSYAITPSPTSNAVGMMVFPKRGRYFRARVSTYTSGTVTVVGNLHNNQLSLTNRIQIDGTIAQAAAVGSQQIATIGAAYNANPTPVANAQYARPIYTLVGVPTNKPYSIPEADWTYSAASGGITNTTTAVTIVAALASNKNYVTAIQLSTDGALGAATEVAIRDGAGGTVLWRDKIPTAGLASGKEIIFPTPLRGTVGNLLEVVTLTATITGAVYFNAQGYQAND